MPEWLETSITVLTIVVVLFGLFGLIIPIFPGLVIIWIAILAFGLVTGFTTGAWILFAVITLLMVIGNTIDGLLMGAKALEYGADKKAILWTLVIALSVSLVLTPIAGLLAAPLSLFGLERANGHDKEKAWAITRGLMTGWGWAFIARFGIGIVMIILWVFTI